MIDRASRCLQTVTDEVRDELLSATLRRSPAELAVRPARAPPFGNPNRQPVKLVRHALINARLTSAPLTRTIVNIQPVG